MSIFTGSGVAIITPFDEQNNIDFVEFEKLIEFNIKNSTDAIIVCGTTGEPSTMNEKERESAIEFVVKTVNSRVRVIAGTGSNCTFESIQKSQRAQKLGVDALLLVTPYYNKCTQNGLVAHFNSIANSVDLPIILYNVPSRTGVNILPQTLKTLSATKNIVAIKEASGDISQITKMASLCPTIDIYSGNDDQVTTVLALGAKGVISVAANIIPKQMHEMVESFLNGDVKKSLALQLEYLDLINNLFIETNPIPAKAALSLMGFKTNNIRLPLTPLESQNVEILRQSLLSHNLIQK